MKYHFIAHHISWVPKYVLTRVNYEFIKIEKMSKNFPKVVIWVKIVNFPENFQEAPGEPPEPNFFPKMI